jgi:hypothetical protein
MYHRNPKTEAGRAIIRDSMQRGAERAVGGLPRELRTDVPGMMSEVVAGTTDRAAKSSQEIGAFLGKANWWVVRSDPGQTFVLGDSVVATTSTLGRVDRWRALLDPDSRVIVMPLNPTYALIIAPQRVVPIADEGETLTTAINRLSWGWADQYVLAATDRHLEFAWPGSSEEDRRGVVPVDLDAAKMEADGYQTALNIIGDALARRVSPSQVEVEEPRR